MRKTLGLIMAVTLIFGSFCYGKAFGQEKQISLKLAHINVADGILDKHAKKFAELVASKTKGRVKVDVYPASQLGNMTEMLEGVSMGSINMCLESEGMLLIFEKDYQIFSAPFLITKDIVTKNEFLKEVRERVRAKNNIRVLSGQGWRRCLDRDAGGKYRQGIGPQQQIVLFSARPVARRGNDAGPCGTGGKVVRLVARERSKDTRRTGLGSAVFDGAGTGRDGGLVSHAA